MRPANAQDLLELDDTELVIGILADSEPELEAVLVLSFRWWINESICLCAAAIRSIIPEELDK